MAATIDICSRYGNHTVVPESGSVVHKELMSDDYIRLVFSTKDRITIHLGDYIKTDWGKFVITKPQAGTYNKTTGGYDYDLQFDAPYYLWQNKLYKYEPNNGRYETNWSLTDTLKNHMEVFLRNLQYYGWKYSVSYDNNLGDDVLGRSVYISFSNVSILDALNTIADKFGMEWLVSDSTIILTEKVSGSIYDPQIDLTVGKEVEDMSAENSSDEGINRYYVFGSIRNIPTNYRKNDKQILVNGVVQKRLMLPQGTDYIGSQTLKTDEIKEGILVFDDVYPRTESTISEVSTVEKTVDESSSNTAEVDTTESSGTKSDTSATSSDASSSTTDSSTDDSTKKVNIYRFKTDGFVFSQDYIFANNTLQVAFTSGKLAGMTFDLQFNPEGEAEKKVVETTDSATNETKKETVNNPDAQLFEIVRNDTYGRWLPDDALHPSKGDKFVLIGWDATKFKDWSGLVEKAEKELDEKASAYISKKGDAPMTYVCTMMADYMYGLDAEGHQNSAYSKVGSFYIGYPVNLHGGSFFNADSFRSRVVGYEYKLDKPYDGAQLYVGNSALYSKSKATESMLNDVKDTEINYRGGTYTPGGNGGGGGNVFILRTNDNVNAPSDNNVYSALRSDRTFASKRKNDRISSLWTFTKGYGAKRGIRSHEYDNAGNEDNLFGHGFELINYQNSNGNTLSRLEVDELLVRVAAFFAQLEIRRISYVGGNYVFTAAGGKVYYVDWLDSSGTVMEKKKDNKPSKFRCYLYSDDGTTSTMNGFAEDDQVMCRTFNVEEGVHKNVSNKYYWRRCVGTGKGVIPGSDDTTEYQYVDLGNAAGDYLDTMTAGGMLVNYPDQGDTLVQFGNWTNSKRQSVIYLMVEGDNAPAIITWANVGADGKHFVLPDEPDIQISPRGGNIFHGRFISVNDVDGYKGMSTDEIFAALLKKLKEIEQQADKKFEMWFLEGTPHPLKGEGYSTANPPASDWITEGERNLHLQDLYYDIEKDPASDGGRAWRWQSSTANNVASWYWEEVTDKDTIEALEKARDLQNQVDDISSDSVLSAGSEKTRLLIEWYSAIANYKKYWEQADDYHLTNDTETGCQALHNAFFTLATMLNNGTTYSDADCKNEVVPSWIDKDLSVDTYLSGYVPNSNTQEVTKSSYSREQYKANWKEFYKQLAAVLKDIKDAAAAATDKAQNTADEAKKSIDDICNDNILDAGEKQTLKRDFVVFWHEMYDPEGLEDKGKDAKNAWYNSSISSAFEAINSAFEAVGTFLNAGTEWSSPSSLSNDVLPIWINDENITQASPTIVGKNFVSLWSDMYAKRTAYLTLLSKYAKETADGKANVFVSDDPPSPPYQKGDMWIQTGNGNNIMICLVSRGSGEKYDDNDWASMSDIYDKYDPRMILAGMADRVWEISGGFVTSNGKISIFLGYSSSISGNEEGDIIFTTGGKVMKWVGSWFTLNNTSYTDVFASAYSVLGKRQINIYSDTQSGANTYDLCLKQISWTDHFDGKTYTGKVDIMMYNEKGVWETLRTCVQAILENMGDHINAVVYGKDGASGLVARLDTVEQFSQKFTFDNDGNVTNVSKAGVVTTTNFEDWKKNTYNVDIDAINDGLGDKVDVKSFASLMASNADEAGVAKTASLSAYVAKVKRVDGTYDLESGILLKADRINLEGLVTANGNFKILEDGSIEATNGKFSGEITATSGKIGAFSIDENGLYSGTKQSITGWYNTWKNGGKENMAYLNTQTLFLQTAIGYSRPGDIANTKVGIGLHADPDEEANTMYGGGYAKSVGYFYRNMNSFDDIYYPAVKIISDNVFNRDIALRVVGGVQVYGGIMEIGHSIEYTKRGDTNALDLSFGTKFLLYTSLSTNPTFFLPKLSDLRKQLGITSTLQPFCVRVSITARRDSNFFYIATTYRAANASTLAEGGILINNDGDEWGGSMRKMGPGDCVVFDLCYTLTTGYYAQLISLQD